MAGVEGTTCGGKTGDRVAGSGTSSDRRKAGTLRVNGRGRRVSDNEGRNGRADCGGRVPVYLVACRVDSIGGRL